jgi:hypothetical protein
MQCIEMNQEHKIEGRQPLFDYFFLLGQPLHLSYMWFGIAPSGPQQAEECVLVCNALLRS